MKANNLSDMINWDVNVRSESLILQLQSKNVSQTMEHTAPASISYTSFPMSIKLNDFMNVMKFEILQLIRTNM